MSMQYRDRYKALYLRDKSPLLNELRRISLAAFPQHPNREALVSLAMYRIHMGSSSAKELGPAFRVRTAYTVRATHKWVTCDIPSDEQKVWALKDFVNRMRPITLAKWAVYLQA
jgi:hypothetical protein